MRGRPSGFSRSERNIARVDAFKLDWSKPLKLAGF